LTSGQKLFHFVFSRNHINFKFISILGNVVPAKPRQLIMGAPRAGESRTGAIFIVGFKGTELLDNSFTVNGKMVKIS